MEICFLGGPNMRERRFRVKGILPSEGPDGKDGHKRRAFSATLRYRDYPVRRPLCLFVACLLYPANHRINLTMQDIFRLPMHGR